MTSHQIPSNTSVMLHSNTIPGFHIDALFTFPYENLRMLLYE